MRVSREEAAQSRDRIIAVSAKLFRERGVNGVGVADLMKAAGLTHGGFYRHFESKEALAAAACTRAFDDLEAQRWSRLLPGEGSSSHPLKRFVAEYLSAHHRDHPETGCALPALSADAARLDSGLRRAFTAGLSSLTELVARALPGRQAKQRRKEALATIACLAGAIALSRAVDDEELSDEILQAVSDWLQ